MEAPARTLLNSAANLHFNNPLEHPDLKILIYGMLDVVSLALCSRVCRAWRSNADCLQLWEPYAKKFKIQIQDNPKRSVLQSLGKHKGNKPGVKNKQELIEKIEAYFAVQKWNQTGIFICQLGPRLDDRIRIEITRNPHQSTNAKRDVYHTHLYSDNGPARLVPLGEKDAYLETIWEQVGFKFGLWETYVRTPAPNKDHQGEYEYQILIPQYASTAYALHLGKLAKKTLQRLVTEEKKYITTESAWRWSNLGQAWKFDLETMYMDCKLSEPIERLADKMGAEVTLGEGN